MANINTLLLKNIKTDLTKAANIISNGGIVAFPTDTVYGLGCNIFNKQAANSIYEIKNRRFDKPLSAHLSSLKQAALLAEELPDIFYELAANFLPGPLTLIVKARKNIPQIVTSGTNTIAIRFPNNLIYQQFTNICNVPLAATSANISGHASPTNAEQVKSELYGKIDAIIDGGECEHKIESTIISLIGTPSILRQGALKINLRSIHTNTQKMC